MLTYPVGLVAVRPFPEELKNKVTFRRHLRLPLLSTSNARTHSLASRRFSELKLMLLAFLPLCLLRILVIGSHALQMSYAHVNWPVGKNVRT